MNAFAPGPRPVGGYSLAHRARAASVPAVMYLPLLGLAVPALGGVYGKAGYYAHVALIVLFATAFLLLRARWPYAGSDITLVFLAPACVMLFSTLYGAVAVHGRLVASDVIELMRPGFFFLAILVGIQIGRGLGSDEEIREERLHRFLFVSLIGITLYNFAFSVFPYLRLEPFFSLADLFGEDETYHKGYAVFRAYGITGQPGTQGILTNLLIVGLLFLLDSGKRVLVCATAFAMNVLVLLLTFSRIGLLMFALIIGLHLLLTRSRVLARMLLVAGVVGVGAAVMYREALVPYAAVMLRGLDLGSGELGTLEYRLRWKAQILNALSGRLDTTLFGFGPAKAYLPTLPGNLRHPDSSYSVYLVRFGIPGAVAYVLPYLYLFGYLLLSNPASRFLKRYRAMLLVLLTFVLTVANLDPPFEQWKIVLLMNTLLGIYVAIGVPTRLPVTDWRAADRLPSSEG